MAVALAGIANLKETPPEEQQQLLAAYAAIQTTSDTVVEWLRCRARFAYMLRYVRIPDVNRGLIPFELWPYLIEIADDWQSGDSWIEGKARQLGYSWLLAAYDVWIGTFRPYARILSFSINQRESDELLNKVKQVNQYLPDWLRKELTDDTKNHIQWDETKAEMFALPSTGKAGRSYTATLVQTDEWAFHENARAHYAAYRSAIADGGQHLAISTGNGVGNMFHGYFGSTNAQIPYRKRFNGWRVRPGRTDEWYEREMFAFLADALDPESENFGKHPGLFRRENPGTIAEMFAVFIGLVYDCFDESIHVRNLTDHWDWVTARFRVAGVDPGQGDPFAIVVIGEGANGHAHQFDEHYEPDAFTEDECALYLLDWHRQAPFDAIFVDGNEGTLIATLRARGLPAYPANKERRTGIGHVYGRLLAANFTIAPHCRSTIKEYHAYAWRTVRRAGDEWQTSTPVENHGDAMDATRYALVGLAKGFERGPDREQQPNYSMLNTARRRPPSPVVVTADGTRDAGVAPQKRMFRGPPYASRRQAGRRLPAGPARRMR